MAKIVAGEVYPRHCGKTLEGDVFDRELPRVVVYAKKRKRRGHAWHSGREVKRVPR